MKKVLVSLAVITILAACGDSSSSTTTVNTDSLKNAMTADSLKNVKMSSDTSMHKDSSMMNKMDTTHK